MAKQDPQYFNNGELPKVIPVTEAIDFLRQRDLNKPRGAENCDDCTLDICRPCEGVQEVYLGLNEVLPVCPCRKISKDVPDSAWGSCPAHLILGGSGGPCPGGETCPSEYDPSLLIYYYTYDNYVKFPAWSFYKFRPPASKQYKISLKDTVFSDNCGPGIIRCEIGRPDGRYFDLAVITNCNYPEDPSIDYVIDYAANDEISVYLEAEVDYYIVVGFFNFDSGMEGLNYSLQNPIQIKISQITGCDYAGSGCTVTKAETDVACLTGTTAITCDLDGTDIEGCCGCQEADKIFKSIYGQNASLRKECCLDFLDWTDGRCCGTSAQTKSGGERDWYAVPGYWVDPSVGCDPNIFEPGVDGEPICNCERQFKYWLDFYSTPGSCQSDKIQINCYYKCFCAKDFNGVPYEDTCYPYYDSYTAEPWPINPQSWNISGGRTCSFVNTCPYTELPEACLDCTVLPKTPEESIQFGDGYSYYTSCFPTEQNTKIVQKIITYEELWCKTTGGIPPVDPPLNDLEQRVCQYCRELEEANLTFMDGNGCGWGGDTTFCTNNSCNPIGSLFVDPCNSDQVVTMGVNLLNSTNDDSGVKDVLVSTDSSTNNDLTDNTTTDGTAAYIWNAKYYKFTATRPDYYVFSTCSNNLPTRMAITSECSPIDPPNIISTLSYNDNYCGNSSRCRVYLTKGQTVYIIIGSNSNNVYLPSFKLEIFNSTNKDYLPVTVESFTEMVNDRYFEKVFNTPPSWWKEHYFIKPEDANDYLCQNGGANLPLIKDMDSSWKMFVANVWFPLFFNYCTPECGASGINCNWGSSGPCKIDNNTKNTAKLNFRCAVERFKNMSGGAPWPFIFKQDTFI